MLEADQMAKLAAVQRARLFNRLGETVGLVLSSDRWPKAWLTDYASMMRDVAPEARSVVLANRDRHALVTTAADAGPAMERLGP